MSKTQVTRKPRRQFKKLFNLYVIWTAILIAIALANLAFNLYLSPKIVYKIESDPNILEDPLEAWSEASYIIWEYNSSHYACRNMSTNMVEYFGTSDDNAIQWAIDNCTAASGGTVYVKGAWHTGTYNAAVTLKDKVRLVLSNGAAGITVTIDSGATATLEDWHNFDYKRWDSGTLVSFVEDRTATETVSYTIFKQGSFTFAKNGTTGAIELTSTNSHTVISTAINNTAGDGQDGGTVLIKEGDYDLSETLIIQAYTDLTIIGEGLAALVFSGSGDAIRCVAANGGATRFIMQDLILSVSNDIDTVIHAYKGNSLKRAVFRNIHISNIHSPDPDTEQQTGIWLNDEAGEGGIYFNYFERIQFYDIYTGIKMTGTASNGPNVNTFEDIFFWIGQGYGIYMNSYADANTFYNLDFEDVNGTQIYTDSDANTFKDVWIEVVSGATYPFHFDENSTNNVIELIGHNYGTLNYLNLDEGSKNRITDYDTNQDFFDKRAINDDGYFQYTCITHPDNSTWTSAKDGYTWYCTDHNCIEYYINPVIYTLAGTAT